MVAACLLALALDPLAAGGALAGGQDGDPCFAGVPVDSLRLERTAPGIDLSWQADAGAAWYEILRCEQRPPACDFVSLAPVAETSYEDAEVPAAAFVGYRVAAIVDPDDNGCGVDTYCSLPAGQCGADGICSLHAELCDTLPPDPVCGCDGNTYLNACFASFWGANVRHPGSCNP